MAEPAKLPAADAPLKTDQNTTVTPLPAPTERPLRRPLPGHLEPVESVRKVLRYKVPDGVTYEDCLTPDFWSQIGSSLLNEGDHVELVAEDASWFALLFVRSSSQSGGAIMAPIIAKTMFEGPRNIEALEELAPVFRGPAHRWCVENQKNPGVTNAKAVNLPNKEAAQAWIDAVKKA